MSYSVSAIPLTGTTTGTERTLTVHRFGAQGARPKAYIQAGLHADEIPGMLVAHHLIQRLDKAAEAGCVLGEILVVPVANPIGLDQVVGGHLTGRHALSGAGNFNRGFPALGPAAAEAVAGRLGEDAAENIAAVRAALIQALASHRPLSEVETWRHALLGMAIDADVVLDLHCDSEAVAHLYTGTPLWPGASDLPRALGCRTVLLAELSGGDPFDEACSAPWWQIRQHLDAAVPLPPACLAATIELRGDRDVDDALASSDAEVLVTFLQGRGFLDGTHGAADEAPLLCEATPLSGVGRVITPRAGVLIYTVAVGEAVETGQPIAEIVDPGAPSDRCRTILTAPVSGVMFARSARRYVHAGDTVAKIAGAEPLAGADAFLLGNR